DTTASTICSSRGSQIHWCRDLPERKTPCTDPSATQCNVDSLAGRAPCDVPLGPDCVYAGRRHRCAALGCSALPSAAPSQCDYAQAMEHIQDGHAGDVHL
ncbi:hypothetical protein FB639_006154, partial [Coemansia asiatica]